VNIEILVSGDCPHAVDTIAMVRSVAERLAPDAVIRETRIASPEQAVAERFAGSPTVRVDGRDIEGRTVERGSMACRLYYGAGVPPEWMLEGAVLRALRPSHVLFLCVANSARSQMAEGLARSMTGGRIAVSSAGSSPTRLNPLAVEVLSEIGIDIAAQGSKGVDEIGGLPVEAVITLCAEEVCPAWLGQAPRIHWGLPDPAAAEGTHTEQAEAFRRVRDELRRRLAVLFGP